ncbi:MAG: winged helix-turn-helix domain-containing protein [Alphaproteobacteria bacterium]
MAIPNFPSLTLPLLQLAGVGDFRTHEAVERLAGEFDLTTAEREERLPSGRETKFANRVHWAIVYLSKAGLICRLSRGLYGITELGRSVLAQPPERIDLSFLSQFEGVKEFNRGAGKSANPTAAPEPASTQSTPEERIDAAFDEINGALQADLLERLRSMQPSAFERLILDLCSAWDMARADQASTWGEAATAALMA